jgi:hypothetical protein
LETPARRQEMMDSNKKVLVGTITEEVTGKDNGEE